jgi:glycosyltransferase involved in cell wall biosynthesis
MTALSDTSAAGNAAARRPEAGGLQVHLDTPMPAELVVGGGTALFVCGWCVSDRGRVTALSLVVDGEEQAVMAQRAPRLDVLRALHPRLDPFALAGVHSDPDSVDDPELQGYRSGFWGMARIAPRPGDAPRVIELRAVLAAGGRVEAELARIAPVAPPAPLHVGAPDPEAGPLVAVAMATYEPPLPLFRAQIASIRSQTHPNWVCVISDDCSSPGRFAELQEVVAGDERFVVSRSERNLGFYRNFERALALVPEAAEYVVMADQDDVWHPDKLASLVAELGSAQLVYSDARIVDDDGEVIAETFWGRRRNNHADLLSVLAANSVTGAASLMRRDLLDTALPFPPAQFAHFHDHWIALCALALGDIGFVDRPLYDYVQHGKAELGHAAATKVVSFRSRLASLRRDPRERIRLWRMIYFVDACRLTQFATVLRMRCADRMPRAKRRALERFLRMEGSLPALANLLGRAVHELTRSRPETLGAELILFYAFLWRRLLTATTRDRPVRGLRLDAVPPPALDPKPGLHLLDAPVTRDVAGKIAPLALAPRDDAPERVNILIPTIDLEHFFGGYIGKLNLARRLAERGLRVRLVTVDPVAPLPSGWQARLEAYSGLAGVFDTVEVAFGRESQGLEVSRSDRFVATTWWTAHIAQQALDTLDRSRFLYLIQEYEPFTFPMGTFAALATESYALPHTALFSTELLRDYFRRHRIGVYAEGTAAGDERSEAFQNAITAVPPPSAAELELRTTRRLLFYARPEPHAARNMFELGVMALNRALREGALREGWELHGIGTTSAGRRLELGDGAHLTLLPRSEQRAYADVLRAHDVGLALMYTPHPSLVPIEMASAGMLTVTNTFENKTPEAMDAISPNIVTAEPTIAGVAAGLVRAAAEVDDFERRARGSHVAWSADWDESFHDGLLARVVSFLGA